MPTCNLCFYNPLEGICEWFYAMADAFVIFKSARHIITIMRHNTPSHVARLFPGATVFVALQSSPHASSLVVFHSSTPAIPSWPEMWHGSGLARNNTEAPCHSHQVGLLALQLFPRVPHRIGGCMRLPRQWCGDEHAMHTFGLDKMVSPTAVQPTVMPCTRAAVLSVGRPRDVFVHAVAQHAIVCSSTRL